MIASCEDGDRPIHSLRSTIQVGHTTQLGPTNSVSLSLLTGHCYVSPSDERIEILGLLSVALYLQHTSMFYFINSVTHMLQILDPSGHGLCFYLLDMPYFKKRVWNSCCNEIAFSCIWTAPSWPIHSKIKSLPL